MICSPAQKRYNKRVIGLSLIYAGLLIGAVWLFKHHAVSGPLAWIVAILPALPIIGIFAAIGGYIVEESDEYLRMLLIRQTLYGSGFSLSIATGWGFLESFGMVHHVETYWVSILWFAGLGIGQLVNRITEGSWS
ncbi:hypothetical protein HZF05_08345 [Sphingomonas sp. CGMCC 1.13654]|uniref:Uncharacterized protein n=1 Tax=Sphingomonas chungangi TaxID=2683589 RepID=A0A838L6K7_9SPHN|nr:hypothetical protein [Sphingomonas chungangi]MBA2934109.1 hypothetical protein [Sphingomonas chungangi]MVW57150.1 hypothetical protein [Sphingomonas chungangi]